VIFVEWDDVKWKPYEVIPIIDVPKVGTMAAISAVEKFKVKSQNDRELLEQAKKEVYTEGYYKGVLIVDPYKGVYPLFSSPHFHLSLILIFVMLILLSISVLN
jgi:leucyl-tRNA synthetase